MKTNTEELRYLYQFAANEFRPALEEAIEKLEKPTTMMSLIGQITDFTCEICYKRKESEQKGEDQDTFMDTVCSECKLTQIIG